jgi:hypothetical protein
MMIATGNHPAIGSGVADDESARRSGAYRITMGESYAKNLGAASESLACLQQE